MMLCVWVPPITARDPPCPITLSSVTIGFSVKVSVLNGFSADVKRNGIAFQFGFMDESHPLFAKWTGSREHFGFLNQPNVGFANFAMTVSSGMKIIEVYTLPEVLTNTKIKL